MLTRLSNPSINQLVWLSRVVGLAVLTGFVVLALRGMGISGTGPGFGSLAGAALQTVGWTLAWAAVNAWLQSARRRFIREARLPTVVLVTALQTEHPHLSSRDCELVLRGLRQFFIAYSRSKHMSVGMPSKVADTAWHAFILHTRAYDAWCNTAFGRKLHHTPAGAMGPRADRNDALRRTWFWACREESIEPRAPLRLPLLFALDAKFNIPGGYRYELNCKSIGQQSDGGAYCAESFSSGGAGGGDDGYPGDGYGFGGSDGGADGGGCGGGGD